MKIKGTRKLLLFTHQLNMMSKFDYGEILKLFVYESSHDFHYFDPQFIPDFIPRLL